MVFSPLPWCRTERRLRAILSAAHRRHNPPQRAKTRAGRDPRPALVVVPANAGMTALTRGHFFAAFAAAAGRASGKK